MFIFENDACKIRAALHCYVEVLNTEVILGILGSERFADIERLIELFFVVMVVMIFCIVAFGMCMEYPNNYRLPCITMPWDIWPALAVLWGVYWMFYSSSATSHTNEARTALEVEFPNTNLENSSYGNSFLC